ncbi:hypothetical protein ACFLY7_00135 [Patescibacteria group bacterium]
MSFFFKLITLFILAVVVTLPINTDAVIGFGGRVTAVTYCTCNASILAYLSNPSGFPVMMTAATRYYSKSFLTTQSQWVLGAIGAPLACMIYAGSTCVSSGAGPIVLYRGSNI